MVPPDDYMGPGDIEYKVVNENFYTVSHVDPNCEYYYKVTSHFMLMFADSEMAHVFGLPTPEALAPTELEKEKKSFTANWSGVPKAERYELSAYGLDYVDTDQPGYEILADDFNNIDSSVTENTDPFLPEELLNVAEMSLDDYTLTKGWTAVEGAVTQGGIGCGMWSMSKPWLMTPPMDVSHSDSYIVKLRVYSSLYDVFSLEAPNGDRWYFELAPYEGSEENGVLEGTVEIEGGNSSERLKLETYSGSAFIIDSFEVYQDIPAGSKHYSLLSNVETDSKTFSHRFDNMAESGFKNFAYRLTSSYTLDNKRAVSEPSDMIDVEFAPSGVEAISSAPLDVTPSAIYSVDGMRLPQLRPGINIVKYSNGEVRKLIVR